MPSSYAWCITRDLLNVACSEWAQEVGQAGPFDAPLNLVKDLERGEGTPFRLLDGDEEVYFEGLITGAVDENDFAPLDDFGKPSYGCTTIQYMNDETDRWEDL